jgi:DNA-directed RNA polymerase specialized sigma24 family protein
MDSSPGDETLLAAVADRDMSAFHALYERHARWLAIRLARRCNDRDLMAGAIQDTFVAVWQRPRGFRGDGDIAAWLWGIAIRRLVSRLRTRGSVAVVFGTSHESDGAKARSHEQALIWIGGGGKRKSADQKETTEES